MLELDEILERVLDRAVKYLGTPRGRTAGQLAVWLHQLKKVTESRRGIQRIQGDIVCHKT